MTAGSWSGDAQLLADAPRELFGSARAMFGLSDQELEALQLEALRYRLATTVPDVPMARRLDVPPTVAALEDIVPFLLPSTVYKSYEWSWLLDGDFARMTTWLQQLTRHSLAGVPTTDCSSVDEWLDAIEDGSALRVCHSSATTGKLSLIPRTEPEWTRRARTMPFANEPAGDEDGPATVSFTALPIVSPFYRRGRTTFLVSLDWMIREYGSEDEVETVYPGRLSSDLMVLAGRLRGGDAADTVPKHLIDRVDDVRSVLAAPPDEALAAFVRRAGERFAGRRILLIGGWPNLVDAGATAGRLGIRRAFAPDSFVHTGGGSKGRVLEEDAYDTVLVWLGVDEIRDTYGRSEIMGMMQRCRCDRYHVNAWQIAFVLEHETLEPLPRRGVQTGRLACVDLMADSYWGGFASSDAVTVEWDGRCECGRNGPRLAPAVQRVSAADADKVSCAATPEAHDSTIELLRGVTR
jgi:hypothetical protein